MGDRFYRQQKEFHKISTTTQSKREIITNIECILGLEGKLSSMDRVTLYGLQKFQNVLNKYNTANGC